MEKLKSIEGHVVYRYIDTLRKNELKSCEEFLDSKWNYKQLANPNYSIKYTKALFIFLRDKKNAYARYLSKNQGLNVFQLKIYEYEVLNKVFNTNYSEENITPTDQRKLNNQKTVLKKMLEQFLVISSTVSQNKRVGFMNILSESLYRRLAGRKDELEYFAKLNFKIFNKVGQQASSSCASLKLNKRNLISSQNFYEIIISNEGRFSQPLLQVMEEEFLINLIRTLCTTKASAYIHKFTSVDLSEFSYLDKIVAKTPETLEIQMYYKLLNLLSNRNKPGNTYFDCFNYFVNNSFYQLDKRQFFGFLFVYLNHKILVGHSIFISARILLIRYVIESEVIPFSSAQFLRLFLVMVRYSLQERINSNWINNFILEMQNSLETLLPVDQKQTLDNIIDAHAFFAEGNFEAAYLCKTRIENFLDKTSNEYFVVQILGVKINYEIADELSHQAFLSRLNFLNSDKSSKHRRSKTVLQAHINFCKAANRLFTQKSKEEYNLKEKSLIAIRQLIMENPIEERSWLIEKLNELSARAKSKNNFYCIQSVCK